MAKKPETKLAEKVKRDLKPLPGVWFVKTQMRARRGIPDFLICCCGVFIAIELKKDGKTAPDPLQQYELKQIAGSGGFSLVAYPENWEDTLEFIKKIIRDSGLTGELQKSQTLN